MNSVYVFSRWWMAAILDLGGNITSKLWNKCTIVFVVFMLVQKDISLLFIAHLLPDSFRLKCRIYTFSCIFNMVDGSHHGFRGQYNLQTLKLVSHRIFCIYVGAKRRLTYIYSSFYAGFIVFIAHLMLNFYTYICIFKMVDGGHLRCRGSLNSNL